MRPSPRRRRSRGSRPAGTSRPRYRTGPAPAPEAGREWTGGAALRRGAARPEPMERAFRSETDLFGAQGWALQHGWTISDGEGPEDAVLRDLLATAPVRPGKEARPAGVLRGRAGTLELVASTSPTRWAGGWCRSTR